MGAGWSRELRLSDEHLRKKDLPQQTTRTKLDGDNRRSLAGNIDLIDAVAGAGQGE